MGYGYYEIPRPEQMPGEKPMKRGYGVSGVCHERGCKERIDRGMAYLCYNCTWYICGKHQTLAYCEHDEPFEVECFAGESSQVCNKCCELLEKSECNC
jgi:hypothetical protein